MFLALVLSGVCVTSLGWAAWSLRRKDRSVAAGAATMSAVTGLAWLAGQTRLEAWAEGGWGMDLLALTGGYALGAAVAYRRSGSRGSLAAALLASAFTATLGGVLYWDATRILEEVLRNADPAAASAILAAAHSEALRLVGLAAGLVLTCALALTLRRPPPSGAPLEQHRVALSAS